MEHLDFCSGGGFCTLDDCLCECHRDEGKPDRETLVESLLRLPDFYFATGIESGDIREMADEMLAHWGTR